MGVRGNLAAARLDRHEIAGSLGDLGTFLPLLLGMAAVNGLDFAAGLFFAGLFNVVTGLAFSIPMAVQPMKAIAAVALVQGLTPGQIVAAGATVSLVVLLLGLTGMLDRLQRVLPRSVVRGLQLALGATLLARGLSAVLGTGRWIGADSWATGIAAAAAVALLFRSRTVPAALLLFGAGVALALWRDPSAASSLALRPWLPRWSPPTWEDAVTSFPAAALPQIPLTVLNSVVAVCALSADLFPDRPAEPRRVAVSVGVMNLVASWFGGMPLCHGAGGLAGQHRFGARTNGSILFLGGAKIVLAVAFGATLVSLCRAFPASILGVMLGISGLELALVVRDQRATADAAVALATAGAILALGSAALGLGVGLAAALAAAAWRRRGAGKDGIPR